MTNGRKVLQLSGAEALCVSSEYLIRYVTGFVAENGLVVVDRTGTTLYTDKRYIEAAEKKYQGTDVTPALYSQAKVMERLKGYQSVGISFAETSHAEYLAFEKEGLTLVNVDEAFERAMCVKNDEELAHIERACEIAEDAFNALLPQIKAGMTETQVAAILEYEMRSRGAEGFSFETIVAFGANAAVPHHVTGNTKLAFGDEILIDFGCKVEGYCSDITRTFLFGDDGKHEEFKRAYACVLTAHELAKEKIAAGMTGKQADAVAREYLTKEGFGELFTHSLGHGIGLRVHESPYVSPKREQILENGMVFSDEPGVYEAGKYGIRIEDTVALKDGKIESFMKKTQKTLIIL